MGLILIAISVVNYFKIRTDALTDTTMFNSDFYFYLIRISGFIAILIFSIIGLVTCNIDNKDIYCSKYSGDCNNCTAHDCIYCSTNSTCISATNSVACIFLDKIEYIEECAFIQNKDNWYILASKVGDLPDWAFTLIVVICASILIVCAVLILLYLLECCCHLLCCCH